MILDNIRCLDFLFNAAGKRSNLEIYPSIYNTRTYTALQPSPQYNQLVLE